jgi:hypothetical protein
MMTAVRRRAWDVALLALGALSMMVIAPIVMFSFATLLAMYDEAHPVADARLAKAERVGEDTVRLQLYVTRRRDCQTLKIEGFSGPHRLAMTASTIMRREDGATPISYPLGVTVLSRPWMMSPVYGPHIWVYGYYDCDDRVVKQRLIDEVLP